MQDALALNSPGRPCDFRGHFGSGGTGQKHGLHHINRTQEALEVHRTPGLCGRHLRRWAGWAQEVTWRLHLEQQDPLLQRQWALPKAQGPLPLVSLFSQCEAR